MALWRDPLDELITDLEQVVPSTVSLTCEIPSMTDHCFFGLSILSRDPGERLRLADDPRVRRVQAYPDRWAGSRPSAD